MLTHRQFGRAAAAFELSPLLLSPSVRRYACLGSIDSAGDEAVSLQNDSAERVRVLRAQSLRGVEVLAVENSDRQWRIFNIAHCIAVPATWQGHATYRRRRIVVEPGMIFCTEPGEIHTTPKVFQRGSFNVFIIDPATFREYLAEQGASTADPRWRVIAEVGSPLILRRLSRLFAGLQAPLSPLELQSIAVGVMESLAFDLVENPPPPRVIAANELDRAARQIRECLHGDGAAQMDLAALAQAVGMSRFQVLRAFKKRYAVPPHTYRLCIQVGLARQLLIQGSTVASAAAESGFSDQSHLARHFKRALGITPVEYLRAQDRMGRKRAIDKGVEARERALSRMLVQPDVRRPRNS
jgi:AraC-like DNA-binding protein